MSNLNLRRVGSVCWALGAILSIANRAGATVEENWSVGTPNNCRNATDYFMDFEQGVDAAQISSTIPGMVFKTTGGLDWAYGDIRTGNYNVGDHGSQSYETNGNFFAWLGVGGNVGRITFPGGGASYFSALVSSTKLIFEAYDKDGNFLADSGWAPSNVDNGTLTRLTVEAADISYIEIHDSGNFWVIDDICTDAKSPCKALDGYVQGPPSDRLDIVFVRDSGYTGTLADFKAAAKSQIDARLLAAAPVSNHTDRFNFYFTEKLGDSDPATLNHTCGDVILPADLREQCPFADAFVVIHSETYGDCSSNRVFSSEGDTVRSFIHEAGHALFGLWDEYDDAPDCGTGRGESDANTWIKQADCLAAAAAHGLPAGTTCTKFTTCGTPSGRWLITDATRYIMADGDQFANGWGNGSTWWIESQVSQLGAAPAMPSPFTSKERSVVMDVKVDSSGVSVGEVGFVLSPAPNYYAKSYDFIVDTWTQEGTWLNRFGFDDPRMVMTENGYAGPSLLDSAQFQLAIPYHFAAAKVTISSSHFPPITVDLGAPAVGPGAPKPNAGGPYEANEGDMLTLNGSASTGSITRYEWDYDGDGLVEATSTTGIATGRAEDDYSGPVYLRVVDSAGLSLVAQSSIVIKNVAPTVTVGGDLKTVVGKELPVSGTFTDPGLLDTHTIEWLWGDGTASTDGLNSKHVYSKPGVYTVKLRVTDDDGGVGEGTFTVTVYHNACLLGDQVTLRDHANVQAPVGAFSYGQFGVEAKLVGDSVVNGGARLFDRAKLTGSLVLAQKANLGNGVTVTGGITENHTPNYLPALERRVFTAGTQPVILTGRQQFNAGSYGAVTIRAGAVVTLPGGTYRLASLNIEADAVLNITGAVNFEVAGDVNFGDRTKATGSTGSLSVYTNGNVCRIGNEVAFNGLLIAPNATVTISSRSNFVGCAEGKLLDIQPDANVRSGALPLPFTER